MREMLRDLDYRIVITRRAGGFELRIEELALRTRGTTLEEAFRRLTVQKTRVLDLAEAIGLLDELPDPAPHPLRPAIPSKRIAVTPRHRD